MGSELLRIAEGFSIVAEGLQGLAKAEEQKDREKTVKAQPSATEKAQKQESTAGYSRNPPPRWRASVR